jgi:hypothetical protein
MASEVLAPSNLRKAQNYDFILTLLFRDLLGIFLASETAFTKYENKIRIINFKPHTCNLSV